MTTECKKCSYGHPKKVLGRAFCTKRDKIINKNYVDLTESVFAVKCIECENIDRWNSLSLEEQNLIMLYDSFLEKGNLDLAFWTLIDLIEREISDIYKPNYI